MAGAAFLTVVYGDRPASKRRHGLASDEEPYPEIAVAEEGQIDRIDRRPQFLRELRRISSTDTEDEETAHIAENGGSDLGRCLIHELRREHDCLPLFAELREHVREGERGEGLELVEIQEERPALATVCP